MSGLRCCTGFSLVAVSRGYFPVAVPGLLTAVPSLVVGHGLRLRLLRLQDSVVVVPRFWSTGSIVVVHGLSCSVACRIFLDQGQTRVSHIGRLILYHGALRKAPVSLL